MLRVLSYIWFAFGVYWVLLAPRPDASAGSRTGRRLKLALLALTLALLFWKRSAIAPLWLAISGLLWAMLALYWIASPKTARSGESPLYRLLRIAVLTAVIALLFWQGPMPGMLERRFVPRVALVEMAGFLLALLGLALTLWARLHLGKFWSDKVVLQDGHRLVKTGPYAHLRHPIYSGVLLAVFGTAMLLGEWRGPLAFAVLLVNYAIKARREERILASQFGDEFRNYQSRTGFLLPRLQP